MTRAHSIPAFLLLCLVAVSPLSAQNDYLAARTKGSASAPVTVYEMSDFQCPFCRAHTLQTFPQIEREYVATGKVRWIFINFPLNSIHPNAIASAEFAMCAAKEGKFWEAHDLLFLHQEVWAPIRNPGPFLLSLADSLKISRPQVTTCLQEGEMRELVASDAQGAVRAGASSTPTFWIEGGIMAGAHPIAVFRQVLDSIYRVKTGGASLPK
jgi:protein-disulfide isomerase